MQRPMSPISLAPAVIGRVGQAEDLGGQGRVHADDPRQIAGAAVRIVDQAQDLDQGLRDGRQLVDGGDHRLQLLFRRPCLGGGRHLGSFK